MIQFEMPRQQRYQLVADDESDMPEWAEEYTICNLRSGSDPGPYMFYGGEWVMLSSYAVRDGTLKIYHDVKAGDQPWDGDASEVREVVVADTVRSIGAGAFTSLESLEYVSIPAGVEVEDGAFSQTFKDPFDADVAMADVAGYEYVGYEGVMYQCDPEIFTYTSNGTSISGLTVEAASAKVLVLPYKNGETVISEIALGAFQNNAIIEKVLSLPDCSITLIRSSTFLGCSALASVSLPESLVTIGGSTFRESGITGFDFPSKITSVGSYTFFKCESLDSLNIPKEIASIGSHAFDGCTAVTSIAFESGFAATLETDCFKSWTFYAADGTTQLDKTSAAALAGKTFKGSASRLVEDAGPQPGMEGRYMYAITTDSAGMNILSVQAAHDGRPLDTVVTASTRRQGAENIPDEWDFVNGVGPFKCWYGAFNIQDYVAGTESEDPVCTGAGMLAYRLDPYDLGATMQGTELQGTYNVFLVVPTVYWKAVGNILYLSDDASYAGITGMTAYAHTATLPDTTQSVFPFIGIGVYEAATDGTRLLSIPGQAPAVSRNHDDFKALADALASAGSSDFQQWNFYHWTLFKMMVYAVLGTKNCQWVLGNGPVSTNVASVTGLSEDKGPYAQSGTDYDKAFLENTWGSCWNTLDAHSVDCELFVVQTLGGADLLDINISLGTFPNTDGATKWTSSASNASATWDVPTATSTTSTASDPATSGDVYRTSLGSRQVHIGGGWADGVGAGVSNLRFQYTNSDRQPYFAARLSAFFDGTAMGTPEVTTKSAPAPTRTSEEDLPDLERDEPDEEPVEEPAEEPVAEESDEGAMDIEGL